MNDRSFLAAFEAAAIPPERWTHRDHVRVGFLYLRELPFDEALIRLRSGIRALNRANGVQDSPTSGYHETLTVAWARVIAAAVAHGPAQDFAGFAQRHPELLKKELLRSYYSRERMRTPEAKATFVEPDIAPLPVIGPGGGSVLEVRHLTPNDVSRMEALLKTFHEAFDDGDTYAANPPSQGYLRRLLGRDSFIALAALKGDDVVGGIAAYELHKFEQERSEIYLYDLAVSGKHRREGLGAALIEKLKSVAAERGAYLVFVQAETDNEPAVALYTKLGRREDVLHFDIAVRA